MNYYRADNEGATRARKYQNTLQNVTILVLLEYKIATYGYQTLICYLK